MGNGLNILGRRLRLWWWKYFGVCKPHRTLAASEKAWYDDYKRIEREKKEEKERGGRPMPLYLTMAKRTRTEATTIVSNESETETTDDEEVTSVKRLPKRMKRSSAKNRSTGMH